MATTVLDHPLALDLLAGLRDRTTPPDRFRTLTRRLGWLLVLEATRDLATAEVEVETPLETVRAHVLAEPIVAIPVLRAGLGLLDATTDLYPDTVVGYLGMERDEVTLEPRDYYAKLPPMGGRRALVLDPMLATGGSGSAALSHVKANAEPRSISFVCVVAAPEGIARLQRDHPDVPVIAGALDRELNANGFILPGLGDFGDRLHGTLEPEPNEP
ncbi:MAG TPA: uracil phosphoribosyltransferase [Actinomycetota bacterium]|nr:uracil phosphoribosyltransferase [Actinomycetota bacterium]